MATANRAFGLDVQTPPCLTQNEQLHARAGISGGSPSHSRSNAILPQWHLPRIRIPVSASVTLQCREKLFAHAISSDSGQRNCRLSDALDILCRKVPWPT